MIAGFEVGEKVRIDFELAPKSGHEGVVEQIDPHNLIPLYKVAVDGEEHWYCGAELAKGGEPE